MWTASALINGKWETANLIELASEPFSSAAVRSVAQNSFPNAPLVRYLSQEAEFGASRDAIELWSKDVQQEAEEFDWDGPARLEPVEEALALYWRDTPPSAASVLAWHDHTGGIITFSGVEDRITVEYVPSPRDKMRVERLWHRYGTPKHELETILDWRGYFGAQSAVIDGWTMMRQRGHGYVASIKGTVGHVVFSVLRRAKHVEPTFERDPTARRRLVRMSERYPHIASGCPDLSTISLQAHDAAVVFVHGAVSCGIQGLKDLYPALTNAPAMQVPIFRYEHDTFLSLADNATELASLIGDRLRLNQLYLVAHSRGGLVGRLAARELELNGYRATISTSTFGTPHQGTPLVALGTKAVNMLYKAGEEIVGSIPVLSTLTKAYSFVYEAPCLPKGIEAMGESSGECATLRFVGDPSKVQAWGSDFDVATAPSGFGAVVEGGLLGAFKDSHHDLVVPSASALGFGIKNPLLQCSHVHYFSDALVHGAIRGLNSPPSSPVAQPQPVPEPSRDRRVEMTEDNVIVDGVSVPRRKPANPVETSQTIAAMKKIKLRTQGKGVPDK